MESSISTKVEVSLAFLEQEAQAKKSEADIKKETDELQLPISIAQSILSPTTITRSVVDVAEHIITVYDDVVVEIPGVPFFKVIKGPFGVPLGVVPSFGPAETLVKQVARNVVIPATHKLIDVVENIESVVNNVVPLSCKLAYSLSVDDITLQQTSNNKLRVTVTISVEAEVIRINFGGILKPSVRGTLKGSGSIKAILICLPSIKDDLSLELTEESTKFEWVKQPQITALNLVSVPLMDLLMPGISQANRLLLDLVTSLVSKFIHYSPSYPMKPSIEKAWNLLREPIAIEKGVFLVCRPSRVVIQKLELDGGYLQTRAQIMAATNVYIQDTSPGPSSFAPFSVTVGSPSTSPSSLQVSATIPFTKLTQDDLSFPGITLSSPPSIRAHPTTPNRIICTVALASPFAMDLQLEGDITLNATNNYVHLTNVNYTLPPSTPMVVVLLDAAIHNVIIQTIQNTVKFSFAQRLQAIYDKIKSFNKTISEEPVCILSGDSERPEVTRITSDYQGVHVELKMVVNQLSLIVGN